MLYGRAETPDRLYIPCNNNVPSICLSSSAASGNGSEEPTIVSSVVRRSFVLFLFVNSFLYVFYFLNVFKACTLSAEL